MRGKREHQEIGREIEEDVGYVEEGEGEGYLDEVSMNTQIYIFNFLSV